MANKWKIAAATVIVIAVAATALLLSGVLPARRQADLDRAQALITGARAQLQSGNSDAALRSLDESIHVYPLADAMSMRATLRIERSDFDGALRDMNAVIGRGAYTAANYSLRCWLRVRLDAIDRASADCDRALRLDPSHASAFGNRGLVGLKRRHHQAAWEDFNMALRVGGSDEWVAWRLFGRGLASWGRGEPLAGRGDIEQALRSDPTVAAQFAQFGLGGDVVRQLEDATYATAVDPPSLWTLHAYLTIYPDGAHAADARARIAEIEAEVARDEAAGRSTIPGFSLARDRGSGPASDSFGAIAISRSSWRTAFATDYATAEEAERAAAAACNAGGAPDCDAYNFRNVCAALALSPRERARGMAWSHARDSAVYTAISDCRDRGGRSCVPVHSQCTPTPPAAATPSASP